MNVELRAHFGTLLDLQAAQAVEAELKVYRAMELTWRFDNFVQAVKMEAYYAPEDADYSASYYDCQFILSGTLAYFPSSQLFECNFFGANNIEDIEAFRLLDNMSKYFKLCKRYASLSAKNRELHYTEIRSIVDKE